MTRLRRVLSALLGTLVLSVLLSPSAAAHSSLVSTDPADGATLATTPDAVSFTFTEPAVALGTQIVVTGPEGAVAVGEPQLVDRTVTQPLVGGAPAGRYTVSWRVTSADGHPITGELTFVSSAAGTGTPGAVPNSTPAPTTDPGVPAWAWPLAALAVLGPAAAVTLVRRRGARRDDTSSPLSR